MVIGWFFILTFENFDMNKTILDTLNFSTKDNQAFEIPVEGSLGLLALGDIGLWAWRQKKMEVYQQLQEQKSTPPTAQKI